MAKRKSDTQKWPVIMVFEGKYSSEYFICNSEDELHKTALYVLWRRWHSGNYFFQDEVKPPPLPSTPKEVIDSLPNGSAKTAGLIEWEDYRKDLLDYENEVYQLKHVTDALSNRDGAEAFRILKNRGECEYETMRVEYPTCVELPKRSLLSSSKEIKDFFL